MSFTATRVVDGDTIEVDPCWKWGEHSGDAVRILGYDTPERGEPGYTAAAERLASLVLCRQVELVDPASFSYGRLLCRVEIGGVDVASYFPEYQ